MRWQEERERESLCVWFLAGFWRSLRNLVKSCCDPKMVWQDCGSPNELRE